MHVLSYRYDWSVFSLNLLTMYAHLWALIFLFGLELFNFRFWAECVTAQVRKEIISVNCFTTTSHIAVNHWPIPNSGVGSIIRLLWWWVICLLSLERLWNLYIKTRFWWRHFEMFLTEFLSWSTARINTWWATDLSKVRSKHSWQLFQLHLSVVMVLKCSALIDNRCWWSNQIDNSVPLVPWFKNSDFIHLLDFRTDRSQLLNSWDLWLNLGSYSSILFSLFFKYVSNFSFELLFSFEHLFINFSICVSNCSFCRLLIFCKLSQTFLNLTNNLVQVKFNVINIFHCICEPLHLLLTCFGQTCYLLPFMIIVKYAIDAE